MTVDLDYKGGGGGRGGKGVPNAQSQRSVRGGISTYMYMYIKLF